MNEHDPRALEWQRRYEQNDTPWDKGAPAPALVHFLRRGLIAGRVLVPGSGRGHEVRAIAVQPGCSVVGLDLAPSATAEARQLAGGNAPGAEFITADFLDLPPALHDSSTGWSSTPAFAPLNRPCGPTTSARRLQP